MKRKRQPQTSNSWNGHHFPRGLVSRLTPLCFFCCSFSDSSLCLESLSYICSLDYSPSMLLSHVSLKKLLVPRLWKTMFIRLNLYKSKALQFGSWLKKQFMIEIINKVPKYFTVHLKENYPNVYFNFIFSTVELGLKFFFVRLMRSFLFFLFILLLLWWLL